jgi:hypothetical protein
MDIWRKWHLTVYFKKIEDSDSFHGKDNSILGVFITRKGNSFLIIQENFSSRFEVFVVGN